MKILLTNDDGVDSVALLPTIEMLSHIGRVRTIVPSRQMSWTSKINTRQNIEMDYQIREINGYTIETIEGFPADCANFGLYDNKPELLVSGANLGHNVGLHAFLSSGTVGAALEGIIAKVPSIAISIPYYQNQELSEQNFRTTLQGKQRIVRAFIDDRPANFNMLNINLPLNANEELFVSTDIDDSSFGGLFKINTNGKITPKKYRELTHPKGENIETDTWAKQMRFNSIMALDQRAQFISKQIVNNWLVKVKLNRNLNEV